ncbi:hypothetical protein H696_04197 [Fonticula alba]|uniref:tRNA-2-methylthio-N6-dimethylallyladenosine synthase n=1 Tax=Fonticula alba TaxID=691883 RepID=A0A058Z4C7_FONAL|nr:hypothetical protein H696_04197 [Fonticula alba]KCV68778.1 hypothetical protein H696_04197 [Fonticula alba]|eukprot:XP_009496349.1 hypothetical protein H696_04197 [Fonticula alba]
MLPSARAAASSLLGRPAGVALRTAAAATTAQARFYACGMPKAPATPEPTSAAAAAAAAAAVSEFSSPLDGEKGSAASRRRSLPPIIPSLAEFMKMSDGQTPPQDGDDQEVYAPAPYLPKNLGQGRTVLTETYGCQMNVNDTEIALACLLDAGYERAPEGASAQDADVVLLMTCAIRDNAETKIWNRLTELSHIKRKRRGLRVGLLGCMAERLKHQVLESDKSVDVVCGPDSYRDLPRLLHSVDISGGQSAINVMLSLDETYADVAPVRVNPDNVSAFVSIMRGCDNMCSYCIVPFTRGRERSRDAASIIREVRQLQSQGVREVTLLGQNVNSYRDTSEAGLALLDERAERGAATTTEMTGTLARGFQTIYKARTGGLLFADLLDEVSAACPDMRFRFTSPHPKDFPDELLRLIAERPNVAKQLHLPAQSGNSAVLERMRRGYTREAYLEMADRARSLIPRVALSSDFIVGFCGETDAEHADTVSLLHHVNYEHAYLFAYSMREKTHAHRTLVDDVPEEVKQARLREVIDLQYGLMSKSSALEEGSLHVILIEGDSRRNSDEWSGRSDNNKMVVFPKQPVPNMVSTPEAPVSMSQPLSAASGFVMPQKGDFVLVRVTSTSAQTYRAEPLALCDVRGLGLSTSELAQLHVSEADRALGLQRIAQLDQLVAAAGPAAAVAHSH